MSDEKIDGDDDYFHAMARMDYDFYGNIVMRKMQKLVEEEVDGGDDGDENGDVDGDAGDDVDDDDGEVHDEEDGEDDDDDADDVALVASSPLLEQLAVVVAVERAYYCHYCYYKHLPSTCCDDEDVTVEMVVHYWNSCLYCGWTYLRVVGLLCCYCFDGWKICYCCYCCSSVVVVDGAVSFDGIDAWLLSIMCYKV